MLRWPEPYGDSWNRTSIAMMQTQYNNLYIMSPRLAPAFCISLSYYIMEINISKWSGTTV